MLMFKCCFDRVSICNFRPCKGPTWIQFCPLLNQHPSNITTQNSKMKNENIFYVFRMACVARPILFVIQCFFNAYSQKIFTKLIFNIWQLTHNLVETETQLNICSLHRQSFIINSLLALSERCFYIGKSEEFIHLYDCCQFSFHRITSCFKSPFVYL